MVIHSMTVPKLISNLCSLISTQLPILQIKEMKRNIVYYAAVLLLPLFLSCKDKDTFTVSGTITNPGSLKQITLIAETPTGIAIVDSTNLSDQGKFAFKHSAPFANLYRLRVGGRIFDFIAKNGDDIEFNTNLSDPKRAYEIKGSDESEKIKDFNNLSNYYVAINTKISNEYISKAQS